MDNKTGNQPRYYLMCERKWIFFILILVAGFFGAYTYLLKGGVFCNAQTGNLILMGMALGEARWNDAVYFLIPMSAYLAGTFISEILPNSVKHHMYIRWDTLLIAIEIIVVATLGFIPDSAPVQIFQIAINFIASMQYNTFRQAEGVPMATTFATNHVRQIGVSIAKLIKHRGHDRTAAKKFLQHLLMLIFFVIGAVVSTILCNLLSGKAIWCSILPLFIVFIALFHADLTTERNLLNEKPSGH